MAGQNTFRASKTIAGAALAGLGLFILYGNLAAEMVGITRLLAANGSATLGLLPAAILSVSQLLQIYAGHQPLLWGFLGHFLRSSWPLLLVMLGTGLSQDALKDEPRRSWRKKRLCSCRSDGRRFDVTAEVEVKFIRSHNNEGHGDSQSH
jgi:hypothetical protein